MLRNHASNSTSLKTASLTTFLLGTFLLTACGGSGTSSTTTTTTGANSAPVISAGGDASVEPGDGVSLTGTATDADGDALTYNWIQTSGDVVTLSDATTLSPSFSTSTVSELVFQLSVSDGTTTVSDSVTVSVAEAAVSLLKASLFSADMTSMELISCTLENGSSTQCYEIKFPSNTVGSVTSVTGVGPYCATSRTQDRSLAGVGVYDGSTNPGFLPILDASLAMEADGYETIGTDGTVYIDDFSGTSGVPDGASACLEAPFDDSLEITYTIPAFPELRTQNYDIQSVGNVGVGLNGIPMKGVPPSVISGPNMGGVGADYIPNIPSIDPCGGHPDPQGYYHWHFIPQATNSVLESDAYNYTELHGITCGNSAINYDEPYAFSGFAQDGFPIYGAYDFEQGMQTEPDDIAVLDDCNGHEHVTPEFADGAYHYHALKDQAPNMLTCLKGSFVSNAIDTGGGR